MRHKPTPAIQPSERQPSLADRGRKSGQARAATALHFKIDRITLPGYSGGEQKRFAQSLQANLTELTRQAGGIQWSSVKRLVVDRLDAGQLPRNATPEAAARRIATQIVAELTKTRGKADNARQSEEEEYA